jgi:hypothetical protein
VMVVSFLVGNINEVFVFVVAANVLLPETKWKWPKKRRV